MMTPFDKESIILSWVLGLGTLLVLVGVTLALGLFGDAPVIDIVFIVVGVVVIWTTSWLRVMRG